MSDWDEDGEREMPSLGATVGGRVFVCHGDDQPEHFVGWLDYSVERFHGLADIASRLEMDADETGIDFGQGVVEFLSDAGIDFDSSHWEGACISGIYQMGWVEKRKVKAVERRIDGLLDKAEKAMRRRVVASMRERLNQTIEDSLLKELVELNAADLPKLQAEVERLRSENMGLTLKLGILERRVGAFGAGTNPGGAGRSPATGPEKPEHPEKPQ